VPLLLLLQLLQLLLLLHAAVLSPAEEAPGDAEAQHQDGH